MNERYKKISEFSILLALAVALPYLFHLTIPQSGKVLLPMHLPVQLAGFLISPLAGLILGIISPPFNFLISGMPPFPLFLTMMFELAAMGFFCGLFGKIMNPLWALLIAILLSKIFLALGWLIILSIGIEIPFSKNAIMAASFTPIITGFPGIALQILIVPSLVLILRRKKHSNSHQ